MKIIRANWSEITLRLFCTKWPTWNNYKTPNLTQSSIFRWRFRCSSRRSFLNSRFTVRWNGSKAKTRTARIRNKRTGNTKLTAKSMETYVCVLNCVCREDFFKIYLYRRYFFDQISSTWFFLQLKSTMGVRARSRAITEIVAVTFLF